MSVVDWRVLVLDVGEAVCGLVGGGAGRASDAGPRGRGG